MNKPVRYNPEGIWPNNGFPFHHAVVEPEGRRVHVSGQVAWNEQREIVAVGDAGGQTEFVLKNIETILNAAGGSLEDVMSFLIFYVNDEDYIPICEKRAEMLPAAHGPATTAVRTAGLVHPDLLIEVAAIAVVPVDRYTDPGQPQNE